MARPTSSTAWRASAGMLKGSLLSSPRVGFCTASMFMAGREFQRHHYGPVEEHRLDRCPDIALPRRPHAALVEEIHSKR